MMNKYNETLFKEYALVRFNNDNDDYDKKNKIAMRWRTKEEVLSGKGVMECANLNCNAVESLVSWEVPFAYTEENVHKKALVKLRTCPPCSKRLHPNPPTIISKEINTKPK